MSRRSTLRRRASSSMARYTSGHSWGSAWGQTPTLWPSCTARSLQAVDKKADNRVGGLAIVAKGALGMFSNRLIRLVAVLTVGALLAGCGSGASSYTPAGQSSQTPGPATTNGAATGAKVHLVYFNARGAEAGERKLVERYMKDHP